MIIEVAVGLSLALPFAAAGVSRRMADGFFKKAGCQVCGRELYHHYWPNQRYFEGIKNGKQYLCVGCNEEINE